jgi:hypothetical protein
MIITQPLNETQLRQINNLLQHCTDKMDMFDHLISIGLNAFHSLHMSNSFNAAKYSYSVMPLVKQQQRKTYHCEAGKVVLIEV